MKNLKLSFTLISILFFICSKSFSQYNCIDSSLSFNGNDQYLTLPPNDVVSSNFLSTLTGDYTIECLVKWDGGDKFQRIFDFSYGTDYFMFLTPSQSTDHYPRFAISTTGLNTPQIVDANTALTPGSYHHIAVTYSKANSIVTIFLDGNNVGSGTVNINADSIYYGTDMHNSSNNFIGLSSFAGDPQLNGDIDEFRISDTVRYTDNFIPALPFTPDEYTVALYHFNEGSGQIAADTSGNNYAAEFGSTPDADANDPTWASCQSVLASTLTSFTATVINNEVHLNWIAPSANINYFEMQHSTNGIQFSTISKIASKAGITNSYAYTDDHPAAGTNYYRLKLIDASGTYSYSQALLEAINSNAGFKVYPTFTAGKLHISATQTPANLIIYNTMGKAVQNIILKNAEQDINVSMLPAGNYILKNVTLGTSVRFIKH